MVIIFPSRKKDLEGSFYTGLTKNSAQLETVGMSTHMEIHGQHEDHVPGSCLSYTYMFFSNRCETSISSFAFVYWEHRKILLGKIRKIKRFEIWGVVLLFAKQNKRYISDCVVQLSLHQNIVFLVESGRWQDKSGTLSNYLLLQTPFAPGAMTV